MFLLKTVDKNWLCVSFDVYFTCPEKLISLVDISSRGLWDGCLVFSLGYPDCLFSFISLNRSLVKLISQISFPRFLSGNRTCTSVLRVFLGLFRQHSTWVTLGGDKPHVTAHVSAGDVLFPMQILLLTHYNMSIGRGADWHSWCIGRGADWHSLCTVQRNEIR